VPPGAARNPAPPYVRHCFVIMLCKGAIRRRFAELRVTENYVDSDE